MWRTVTFMKYPKIMNLHFLCIIIPQQKHIWVALDVILSHSHLNGLVGYIRTLQSCITLFGVVFTYSCSHPWSLSLKWCLYRRFTKNIIFWIGPKRARQSTLLNFPYRLAPSLGLFGKNFDLQVPKYPFPPLFGLQKNNFPYTYIHIHIYIYI